jgi:hypothetical protein
VPLWSFSKLVWHNTHVPPVAERHLSLSRDLLRVKTGRAATLKRFPALAQYQTSISIPVV